MPEVITHMGLLILKLLLQVGFTSQVPKYVIVTQTVISMVIQQLNFFWLVVTVTFTRI